MSTAAAAVLAQLADALEADDAAAVSRWLEARGGERSLDALWEAASRTAHGVDWSCARIVAVARARADARSGAPAAAQPVAGAADVREDEDDGDDLGGDDDGDDGGDRDLDAPSWSDRPPDLELVFGPDRRPEPVWQPDPAPRDAGAYLRRYLAGEHAAVWAELCALGGAVRSPGIERDAWEVACEAARRARHNLEVMRVRLRRAGYQFVAPALALVRPAERPSSDPRARAPGALGAIEAARGPLPLVLRAFFEHVESVNFIGEVPFGLAWQQRIVAPLVVRPLSDDDAHDEARLPLIVNVRGSCNRWTYFSSSPALPWSDRLDVALPDAGFDAPLAYNLYDDDDGGGGAPVFDLATLLRTVFYRGGVDLKPADAPRTTSALLFAARFTRGLVPL